MLTFNCTVWRSLILHSKSRKENESKFEILGENRFSLSAGLCFTTSICRSENATGVTMTLHIFWEKISDEIVSKHEHEYTQPIMNDGMYLFWNSTDKKDIVKEISVAITGRSRSGTKQKFQTWPILSKLSKLLVEQIILTM